MPPSDARFSELPPLREYSEVPVEYMLAADCNMTWFEAATR
jgi:hypothetical protein